jgi:hypothetical protein
VSNSDRLGNAPQDRIFRSSPDCVSQHQFQQLAKRSCNRVAGLAQISLKKERGIAYNMWTNAPLTVYHGTDEHSAENIRQYGVDLAKCRRIADLGRGLYVTSVLSSAQYWANEKVRRLRSARAIKSSVLTFDNRL